MKTKLLKSVAFLLVLTMEFTSCRKPDQPPTNPGIALKEVYIPCIWGNLGHQVTIINNDEELQKHIPCYYHLDTIDFSKHTLLLTGGMAGSVVCSNAKQATFFRDKTADTSNTYNLKINIRTGTVERLCSWTAAYLIPKLPENVKVTSNITYEAYYDDTDFSHDESASIIGKWKLVWGRTSGLPYYPHFMSDYSAYDVVYEFKSDGILSITGETEIFHPLGDNTYAFEDDEDNGFPGYPYGLTINDGRASWYGFNSDKLVIDHSPLDGPTFHFIKIN